MYQNFNVEGLNIKKNLNTIKIYVKLWYTKSLYEIILWYQLKLINYRLHNIDLSYLGMEVSKLNLSYIWVEVHG